MQTIKLLFFLIFTFYSVESLSEHLNDGPRSTHSMQVKDSGYTFKQRDLEKILGWVRVADVEIDAYTSISKNDFRFIAYLNPINGQQITPQDNACMFEDYSRVKKRLIDGPYPARPGERPENQHEIVALFDEYVSKYNSIIKTYLSQTKALRCYS